MLGPASAALWGLLVIGPPTATEAEPEVSAAPPRPAPRPLAGALTVAPGATCVDARQLGIQVQSWLDIDALDPRIDVEVIGDPVREDRLEFRVRLDDEVIAERWFDPAPERCIDLHAVVGLAVAMAIEAAVVEAGRREAQTPEPPAPEQPKPAPVRPRPKTVAPPTAAPPPEPKRRLSIGLGLTGGLLAGVLPGVAGGGSLLLDLSWVPWSELRVGAIAAGRGGVPFAEGEARMELVAGRVDACFGNFVRAVRPRICGGLAGGAFLFQGRGFSDHSERGALPAVLAQFGLGVQIPISSIVALDIAAEGVVSLRRPRLVVVDQTGATVEQRVLDPGGLAISLGFVFAVW
ncbi:MAG: hypothetical protein KC636_06275 [Myxococcales bacterium]|nr:hypothetical protein [Myxococcales bacterium]